MGAVADKTQQFKNGDYAPPLQQYKLKHCGHNYYVWDHCMQNQSALIQFPINIVDQNMLKQQTELFMFRHRHPILVSTLFFRQNPSGKASIFYQRVFTNLSRIKDIPFEDSLQFYYTALKGFEILYKRYGYFPIQEEMFHVTLNKKVKIWCHKDISKSKPSLNTSNGTEQDMVRKIIRIIEENSDNSSSHCPVNSILYEQAASSFSSALLKFREICFDNNLVIPSKLKCLDAISEGQIGSLLDQYGEFKQSPIFSQLQGSNDRQDMKIQKNLQTFKVQRSSSIPDVQTRRAPIQSKLLRGGTQYPQNRDCSGQKIPRKTAKGLQVSLHLSSSKDRSVYQSHDRNLLNNTDSPIKSLDKQQKTVSQAPIQENVTINRNPCLQRPSSQKIINTYHPHLVYAPPPPPCFVQNRLSLNNYTRPITNIPQRHTIVRNGSFGNLNMNQAPVFNMKQPEYRVVVNVANRPPSPGPNTMPQKNCVPQRVSNNFLSPNLPFPFTPSPIQNSNIRESVTIPQQNLSINRKVDQNIKIENKSQAKTEISDERQNQRPVPEYPAHRGLKHRDTFISNISSFNQTPEPFKDYSNFKSRFENYKKQFNVNFKNDELPRNNTENSSSRNEIRTATEKKLSKKPFFAGILNSDTVNSYIESNGFCSEKRNISSKSIKNDVHDFPSVTDVSDNVSYFPSKQKTENGWREESLVVKHDPNVGKISLPESKKYEPEIDSEIWADMMKVKNKMKYAVADVKV